MTEQVFRILLPGGNWETEEFMVDPDGVLSASPPCMLQVKHCRSTQFFILTVLEEQMADPLVAHQPLREYTVLVQGNDINKPSVNKCRSYVKRSREYGRNQEVV